MIAETDKMGTNRDFNFDLDATEFDPDENEEDNISQATLQTAKTSQSQPGQVELAVTFSRKRPIQPIVEQTPEDPTMADEKKTEKHTEDIEFDIDEFDSMLYGKNGSIGVCNTDDQNTLSIIEQAYRQAHQFETSSKLAKRPRLQTDDDKAGPSTHIDNVFNQCQLSSYRTPESSSEQADHYPNSIDHEDNFSNIKFQNEVVQQVQSQESANCGTFSMASQRCNSGNPTPNNLNVADNLIIQDPISGQSYEVRGSQLSQFLRQYGEPTNNTLTINKTGLFALLKKLWTLQTLEEVKPDEYEQLCASGYSIKPPSGRPFQQEETYEFECGICPRLFGRNVKFKSKNDKKRHIDQHLSFYRFKCLKCEDERFARHDSVKRHVEEKHGKKATVGNTYQKFSKFSEESFDVTQMPQTSS